LISICSVDLTECGGPGSGRYLALGRTFTLDRDKAYVQNINRARAATSGGARNHHVVRRRGASRGVMSAERSRPQASCYRYQDEAHRDRTTGPARPAGQNAVLWGTEEPNVSGLVWRPEVASCLSGETNPPWSFRARKGRPFSTARTRNDVAHDLNSKLP
jgi:hypothetical protein